MAKITVDLNAGLGEFSFDGQMMPEGVYGFTINEPATVHEKNGESKTMKIVLTVADPAEYKGQTKWYFRTRDLTTEQARKGLRSDLIAVGVDPAKLTATTPYDEENTWNGKKGHFYYRPKVEGEQFDILKLIQPKAVAEIKARFASGATATGGQAASGSGQQKNGAANVPHPSVPQPPVQNAGGNGQIDDL